MVLRRECGQCVAEDLSPGRGPAGFLARLTGLRVPCLAGDADVAGREELDVKRVAKPSDVVKVGDTFDVKIIDKDDQGRWKLSRKVLNQNTVLVYQAGAQKECRPIGPWLWHSETRQSTIVTVMQTLTNRSPLVGRWREVEEGKPVDASGGLPDGSSFIGVAGLESGLLKRPEIFATTLTEKLLTFALGRGIQPDDGPAVRQISTSRRNS